MTLLPVLLSFLVQGDPLAYPHTARGDVVDLLHGVSIADPYRWLEDDVRHSDDVSKWVAEQNELTFSFLKAIPQRAAIEERLLASWDYQRRGLPTRRGDRWFQTRNDGLQDQDILYTGDGPDTCHEVLLNPNTWSEDGTIAMSTWSPDPSGRFLLWGRSEAGSDWDRWYVRDLQTGEQLPDELQWIKFGSPAWLPDGSGFYYARYPAQDAGQGHVDAIDGSQLWYHRIGDDQGEDRLVLFDAAHPRRFYAPSVTEDGAWLVVSVSEGTAARNTIAVARPAMASHGWCSGSAEEHLDWLVEQLAAKYDLIGAVGDDLFFVTDDRAPRGRIVAARHDGERWTWREVVAQRSDILDSADIVGGGISVRWMRDASSAATLHDLNGTQHHEITLPGIGYMSGLGGRNDATESFFAYSSFNHPPSIHHVDLATAAISEVWQAQIPIDASPYQVRRVFVPSTDGARVPIFIVARSGIQLDGNNPLLLYGYGGFDIAMRPYFSVSRLAWLDMGGVLAISCLRGGSEYGRPWHEAGMFERKQQVFDDFIACAQWLIDEGWTRPARLAIQGGSNGGLLVGACMTQRPGLFGACLPAVGVMDMLRFHRFTVGWAWTAEYGSPDDPRMFHVLHGYSPYHSIRPGTHYPATLVTTGDTDDRVVPGHSFKFAAALQAAQAGDAPILVRIETRAGHGAGKPMRLRLEETADTYAFLVEALGMDLTTR